MVVGLALVAFAVAGLAVDGTRAFLARRSLQNAADASALAAASELDASAYYSSSGRAVVLDPEAAREVALAWLARRGIEGHRSITADPNGVSVVLRDAVETSFLAIVGISSLPVAAEATARPLPASR